MHACVYVHMYMCYVCVYACAHVYICIHMYTDIFTYRHVCVRMLTADDFRDGSHARRDAASPVQNLVTINKLVDCAHYIATMAMPPMGRLACGGIVLLYRLSPSHQQDGHPPLVSVDRGNSRPRAALAPWRVPPTRKWADQS